MRTRIAVCVSWDYNKDTTGQVFLITTEALTRPAIQKACEQSFNRRFALVAWTERIYDWGIVTQ